MALSDLKVGQAAQNTGWQIELRNRITSLVRGSTGTKRLPPAIQDIILAYAVSALPFPLDELLLQLPQRTEPPVGTMRAENATSAHIIEISSCFQYALLYDIHRKALKPGRWLHVSSPAILWHLMGVAPPPGSESKRQSWSAPKKGGHQSLDDEEVDTALYGIGPSTNPLSFFSQPVSAPGYKWGIGIILFLLTLTAALIPGSFALGYHHGLWSSKLFLIVMALLCLCILLLLNDILFNILEVATSRVLLPLVTWRAYYSPSQARSGQEAVKFGGELPAFGVVQIVSGVVGFWFCRSQNYHYLFLLAAMSFVIGLVCLLLGEHVLFGFLQGPGDRRLYSGFPPQVAHRVPVKSKPARYRN
jgi:hypothetical protein